MITVGAILDTYLNRPSLKPETRVQYDRAVRRLFADWWDRPVMEITKVELSERFGGLERTDGKAPASNLLAFTVLSGACIQSPLLFPDGPPPIIAFVKATRAAYKKQLRDKKAVAL